MIRSFKLLIVLSFSASLLLSCGRVVPASMQGQPLRMAYASRWGDYTMIIAEEAGFFDRHGVVVEPIHYPISYDAVIDLAAEEIDGGIIPIGDAINVASHTEIKVVAISDDGRGYSIIASSDIATLSDLKGKRIGIELGTWHGLLISELLKEADIHNSDVILSDLHPEKVPDALGHLVDAGITWEPFTSFALAKTNRIIFDPGQFTGSFPNVIVVQKSVLEDRPEEVRRFLRAWFEAVEFRRNNPEEAIQEISRELGLMQDNGAKNNSTKILNRLENYSYFQGAASVGLPPLSDVTKLNANYLLRIGVLTKSPDLGKLLDPSYLQ